MPLFEEGKRPLVPTELGRSLAEIGNRIHQLNQEASALVAQCRHNQTQLVRFGGTPIFMDGFVSKMIGEFQVNNPEAMIEQSYAYAEDLISRLKEGELDLAIVPMDPDKVPEDMEFTPLLQGVNVIACRTRHPLTRKGTFTAKDLNQYPWIAPPAGSPLAQDLSTFCKSIGSEGFRINFSGGTFSAICNFLLRSDALTVLPKSVVQSGEASQSLAILPIKIPHPTRYLGIMERQHNEPSQMHRKFHKFLEAEVKEMTSSDTLEDQ